MAYSSPPPERPEPPKPTEHVSLFGVANGVWRFAFLGFYFFACGITLPSCRGCSLGQLLFLHSWWWLCACYFAQEANAFVCELADEAALRAHDEALRAYTKVFAEWMGKRPIRSLERKDPDGELEPVYAPVRERPLIDREMGVRVRT
jgi:hypothetical protein